MISSVFILSLAAYSVSADFLFVNDASCNPLSTNIHEHLTNANQCYLDSWKDDVLDEFRCSADGSSASFAQFQKTSNCEDSAMIGSVNTIPADGSCHYLFTSTSGDKFYAKANCPKSPSPSPTVIPSPSPAPSKASPSPSPSVIPSVIPSPPPKPSPSPSPKPSPSPSSSSDKSSTSTVYVTSKTTSSAYAKYYTSTSAPAPYATNPIGVSSASKMSIGAGLFVSIFALVF